METRARQFRLVSHYLVHEGSAPLRGRIGELFPTDAEYVVLDLDRTVHAGVTIGERLGWEIVIDPLCRAARAVHDDGKTDLPTLLAANAPLHSVAALARGARRWAFPGLAYALTVPPAERWPLWQALIVRMIGVDYVERVQSMLRSVLMANAADYTPEQLEEYAERAWQRCKNNLVIDAGVVEAIRRHCRRLRAIIVSSASTAPTVRHAAGKLGVDDFLASSIEVYTADEKRLFAAPVDVPAWLRPSRPCFFSRPEAVIHNSAGRKVDLLHTRYPDLFAPGTVSVGITDNAYGEDDSWPDYFQHVIALNSPHPFSPLVATRSPCKTIQIADAAPLQGGSGGDHGRAWMGRLQERALDASTIARGYLVKGEPARLESLFEQLRAVRAQSAQAIDASLGEHIAMLRARLAEAVDRYNEASAGQKAAVRRSLDHLARKWRRFRRRLARIGQQGARIQFEINLLQRRLAQLLTARDR